MSVKQNIDHVHHCKHQFIFDSVIRHLLKHYKLDKNCFWHNIHHINHWPSRYNGSIKKQEVLFSFPFFLGVFILRACAHAHMNVSRKEAERERKRENPKQALYSQCQGQHGALAHQM